MAGWRVGRFIRRVWLAIATGMLVYVAACGGGSSAPPAAPSSAPPSAPAVSAPAPGGASATGPAPAPPARVPLQYGSIAKTAWDWHRIVVFNKGFFERAGFDAEWTLFRTPPSGAQLLTAGSLDLMAVNPETVIRSVQNGAPMIMVGSDMDLAPFSFIVRPDIQSFADLRGKTLPSAGPREAATAWMKRILSGHGVQDHEYDVVVVGASPERIAALRSGAVAGAFASQPLDFQLMAEGYRRLAVVSEYVPDHAIGVHAARTQWLQEHPERAAAALRAMRDAVRWLYDPANKDEAIALLVREAEVTEPLARQTYEFLVEQLKMWNPNLDLAPGIVQKSIDFMAEVGELDPPLPTPQRYMDQRYVQQINQGG